MSLNGIPIDLISCITDIKRAWFVAIKNGLFEFAESLVVEVDVKDDDGNTALMIASILGNVKMIYFLLARGANINSQNKIGATALFQAVNNSHLAAVMCLLRCKADPSLRTVSGKTALFFAPTVEIAQLLLKCDVEVNAKDNDGMTASMWAHHLHRYDVQSFLIEKGSEFDDELFNKVFPKGPPFIGGTSNTAN